MTFVNALDEVRQPPFTSTSTLNKRDGAARSDDRADANDDRALPNPDERAWAIPRRLDVLPHVPAQMPLRERLLLYSLVFGRAPERSLEIGVADGGSTEIILAALDDLGSGMLVSVDPRPIPGSLQPSVGRRFQFFMGRSPEVLENAMALAQGPFDFVLVDGDHGAAAVSDDLQAIERVTTEGAFVLLHDAHHPSVREGIDRVLRRRSTYVDAGLVCQGPVHDGAGSSWAGFRLLARRRPLENRRPSPGRSWRTGHLFRRLSALIFHSVDDSSFADQSS